MKGCFIHLYSNIWKHVQNLGLAQRYNHEEEFTLHLRMRFTLAFLPPEDVIEGSEELSDTIRGLYNDTVDDLLQYFEDTYIGRFRMNAPRRPPLFPIDLWDMFHRTDNELPRTNNSVEGWHRSFQVTFIILPPCVLEISVDSPKMRGKHGYEYQIIQQHAGHPDPPPRQRYLDCNRRIIMIVDDYPNRQRLHYLRAIALDLSFRTSTL